MSNLYMTTEEFADMVVQALHDQNYFKKGGKHHPGDIVIAFTSAAESIASALEWAITQEGRVRKEQEKKKAVMRATTLAKILPEDDEIAPMIPESDASDLPEDYEFDYSTYRWNRKNNG